MWLDSQKFIPTPVPTVLFNFLTALETMCLPALLSLLDADVISHALPCWKVRRETAGENPGTQAKQHADACRKTEMF